uniref:Uncharacterized protein n=1 Tax=Anguilla anguilla TaxID=7936 RepID=A0A0E9PN86_ANGAN
MFSLDYIIACGGETRSDLRVPIFPPETLRNIKKSGHPLNH